MKIIPLSQLKNIYFNSSLKVKINLLEQALGKRLWTSLAKVMGYEIKRGSKSLIIK
jgi:hypothetical protein